MAAVEVPAAPVLPGNTPEYSVSELAGALKRTVEDAYGYVRVRGEITGWKRAASGHAYLCLKDPTAVLDAVIWKATANALRFRAEDGLEVVATGKLTTYPGRSRYQLIVERLEPAGVGALLLQLEERKRRLAADGLFDEARKRPLPYLPGVIGVITSPTGAVIRDILHRLADRFPRHVIVWPVPVQGDGAAPAIAAALAGFNALPPGIPVPELLIVARGGGSIEDLAAFNEEAVVRAVASSAIPVITAVGHETDTTLVDFASDKRCPTPTAAAECAVPVRAELQFQLDSLAARLTRATARHRDLRGERLTALGRRLPSPRALLALREQRHDELAERLPRALSGVAERGRSHLARDGAALRPQLLAARLTTSRERLARAAGALAAGRAAFQAHERSRLAGIAGRLRPSLLIAVETRARDQLTAGERLLGSLSPLAILARGYAVVTDKRGQLVTSAAAAGAHPVLTLRFHDASLPVTTKVLAQGRLF